MAGWFAEFHKRGGDMRNDPVRLRCIADVKPSSTHHEHSVRGRKWRHRSGCRTGTTGETLVRLVRLRARRTKDGVTRSVKLLESLGLRVGLGRHVFDKLGYLAGRDEDRLTDINEALADPEVRALIATRGGKGAHRIADGIDFAAMRGGPETFDRTSARRRSCISHCASRERTRHPRRLLGCRSVR